MKKTFKSFWGLIPTILLLLGIALSKAMNFTPDLWSSICACSVSILFLLIWLKLKYRINKKDTEKPILRVFDLIINAFSISIFVIMVFSLIFVFITHQSENTENIIAQKTDVKELNIEVLPNEEDEIVFSISIDDFIESYNGYYWLDHKARYLLPRYEWSITKLSSAIHSDHETNQYNFTLDDKMWSLPTFSVYVPTNTDYIQQVTLNFDDHSYTEDLYDLYEEMCFYTLKVFFPDMPDENITQLYKTINTIAYENIYPNEKGYDRNSVPHSLFYTDGIGIYPYFATGECVHLTIIPVTEEIIGKFRSQGVIIHEIPL